MIDRRDPSKGAEPPASDAHERREGAQGTNTTGPESVSHHRYPGTAIVGDYGRATAGVALTLGPLAFVDAVPEMVYILGGLGTLFLAFGLRTVLRHVARFEVSHEEIRARGLASAVLRWRDLNGMTLSYYSTRRDRREGWMQLKLRASGRSLKIDSSIAGFAIIVRHALAATRANRVALDERTLANAVALGIPVNAANGVTTGET